MKRFGLLVAVQNATDRRHLTANTSWDPFGGSSHRTSMFTFNASE
jgi:hypothetical protein